MKIIKMMIMTLLLIIVFNSCATSNGVVEDEEVKEPIASEKTIIEMNDPVDVRYFGNMHWGITMGEILDIIGNEYVEDQTNDVIQIFFKGSDIVLGNNEYIIPTVISLGFTPEAKRLQSAQILFVNNNDMQPDLYLEEYFFIEGLLNEDYGEVDKLDWYSPLEQPEFSGIEIVNKELAMITSRARENKIITHSILNGEVLTHTLAYTNPKIQGIEESLEYFVEAVEETFNANNMIDVPNE